MTGHHLIRGQISYIYTYQYLLLFCLSGAYLPLFIIFTLIYNMYPYLSDISLLVDLQNGCETTVLRLCVCLSICDVCVCVSVCVCVCLSAITCGVTLLVEPRRGCETIVLRLCVCMCVSVCVCMSVRL